MAKYNAPVITNVGIELLRNITLNERSLTAVEVVTSEDVIQQVENITKIPNVVQRATYSLYPVENNQFVMEAQISNINLNNSYSLNTIGFYASDGVNSGVLFAVITAQNADVIPLFSNCPINVNFKMIVTLDGNGNIVVTTSFAGYVLRELFEEKNAELHEKKADKSELLGHTGDTTLHTNSSEKAVLTSHTGNTTIHVNSDEKAKLNNLSLLPSLRVAVFTSTTNWTVPNYNTTMGMVVLCVGGGGAGGGRQGSVAGGGAGGGGGGHINISRISVNTGNSVSVIIGSGGTWNSVSGSTSFGLHLTAAGGGNGIDVINGVGGSGGSGGTGGGAGGMGGSGGVASNGGDGSYGGGGGGSSFTSNPGSGGKGSTENGESGVANSNAKSGDGGNGINTLFTHLPIPIIIGKGEKGKGGLGFSSGGSRGGGGGGGGFGGNGGDGGGGGRESDDIANNFPTGGLGYGAGGAGQTGAAYLGGGGGGGGLGSVAIAGNSTTNTRGIGAPGICIVWYYQ